MPVWGLRLYVRTQSDTQGTESDKQTKKRHPGECGRGVKKKFTKRKYYRCILSNKNTDTGEKVGHLGFPDASRRVSDL